MAKQSTDIIDEFTDIDGFAGLQYNNFQKCFNCECRLCCGGCLTLEPCEREELEHWIQFQKDVRCDWCFKNVWYCSHCRSNTPPLMRTFCLSCFDRFEDTIVYYTVEYGSYTGLPWPTQADFHELRLRIKLRKKNPDESMHKIMFEKTEDNQFSV